MIHASPRPPRLRARLAAGLATAAIAIGGLALAPAAAHAGPALDWPSTLSVGTDARGLDVAGDRLFVASRYDAIHVVEKSGDQRKLVTEVSAYTDVAVDSKGNVVYAQDSDRNIYQVSAGTVDAGSSVTAGTKIATLNDYNFLYQLAFDPSDRLYVGSASARQLLVLSGSSAIPILESPRRLRAMDFGPGGDLYLLFDDSSSLHRISASALADDLVTDDEIRPVPSAGQVSAYGIAWIGGDSFFRSAGSVTRFTATPAVTTGTPVIAGDRSVGGTLTAAPGDGWTVGASFAYRWLRDGEPIDGATASSYLLTAADRGTEVSVEVTGSLAGHSSSSAESDPAGTIFTGMLTPGVPTVSGELVVGSTITGTTGAWKDGVALSYQWLREKTPIDGATGSSYTLTAADVGFTIALAVTGTLEGYNSETARIRTSAPVVAPPVVTPPVVTPPTVAPPTPALPAPVVSVDDLVAVGGTLAGSEITVRGSGLAPGSAWSVWLRSTPTLLASGTADASGSFEQVVTLPASVEPGAHRLIVRGLDRAGATVESTVFVTVEADGTLGYSSSVRPEPAALPSTGADASGALLALALLLGGFGLIAARRRSAA